METFITCADCEQNTKEYAIRVSDNAKLCYKCAAKDQLNDLKRAGKGHLYTFQTYSHGCDFYNVGDWTGAVKIECYNVRYSWHNFAGEKGRLDMHFDLDGSVWLATRIGDHDFTRVRRTKKKVSA